MTIKWKILLMILFISGMLLIPLLEDDHFMGQIIKKSRMIWFLFLEKCLGEGLKFFINVSTRY